MPLLFLYVQKLLQRVGEAKEKNRSPPAEGALRKNDARRKQSLLSRKQDQRGGVA